MCKVQKKSLPDPKRPTNLFRVQSYQASKTYANFLKRMELAVEFGAGGTQENFLLKYERLIVVLANSLFPRLSQKEIGNRFHSYEIKQDNLREGCD